MVQVQLDINAHDIGFQHDVESPNDTSIDVWDYERNYQISLRFDFDQFRAFVESADSELTELRQREQREGECQS